MTIKNWILSHCCEFIVLIRDLLLEVIEDFYVCSYWKSGFVNIAIILIPDEQGGNICKEIVLDRQF
jgi:hypothetical protein